MPSTEKLQAYLWKYIFMSALSLQPATHGCMAFIGVPKNFMFDKWLYFGLIGWKYSGSISNGIDTGNMDGLPTSSIMVKLGTQIRCYEYV